MADGAGNEAVFDSPGECVEGLQRWFTDVLEASAQGLSDEGIEAQWPGLLGRLKAAIESVTAPTAPTLEVLDGYAAQLAQAVLEHAHSAAERELLGVPTEFSLSGAGRLDQVDRAGLRAVSGRDHQ